MLQAAVAAAVVDQAEERQQLRPGAVALVHRVGVAAGVGAQPLEEAGDRVVVGVDRVAGEQAAVLGVEEEHEPHEDGEQAGVDLVRVVGEHLAEQLALALVVGRLEAAEQLVEGGEHLLGQLRRDDVLVLAALGEDGRAAAACPAGVKSRSAQSSMCRAAKIGRPATSVISATGKVSVAAGLAARGVDEPQVRAVDEQADRHLRSRAAAARTGPAGWPASGGLSSVADVVEVGRRRQRLGSSSSHGCLRILRLELADGVASAEASRGTRAGRLPERRNWPSPGDASRSVGSQPRTPCSESRRSRGSRGSISSSLSARQACEEALVVGGDVAVDVRLGGEQRRSGDDEADRLDVAEPFLVGESFGIAWPSCLTPSPARDRPGRPARCAVAFTS